MKKVYIAGKITGLDNFKKYFDDAEAVLRRDGHAVMNPAALGPGFDHAEYMKICYSMIDVCDTVYFLGNWRDSKGARMEHAYAQNKDKRIVYQDGEV